MHYHKKNYFKGGVSESVQNQVHTKDMNDMQVKLKHVVTESFYWVQGDRVYLNLVFK